MNVLFDEQNNVLAELSGDAVIPMDPAGIMTAHHDVFLVKDLEELIAPLGGSVHSHTISITKEEHV